MRTYGELKLEKRVMQGRKVEAISVHLEPQVAARFKRVFDRAEKGAAFWIHLQATEENAREVEWFIQRYPLELNDGDRNRLTTLARAFDAQIDLMGEMLSPDYHPPTVELALPPRPYQLLPAEIVIRSGGLLCLDEIGLGKTVEAIVLMAKKGTLPMVVVTKTDLPRQWADEIQRFLPTAKTYILTKATPFNASGVPQCLAKQWRGPIKRNGRKAPDAPFEVPDVVITSYSKLHGWAEWLVKYFKPKSVVWDEVQEARRGEGTLKGTAMKFIADHVEYRLGLSATPIHNNGSEIFPVLEVVKPAALGSHEEFYREYCQAGGVLKEAAVLGAYLRERGLVIARTKKEVGRELPPVVIAEHFCDCDPAAIEELKHSTKAIELAKFVLAGGRQAWEASGKFDLLVRQQTGIAKAPYVAAFVNILLESEQPVVLYGWHHAVYDLWKDLLKEHKPAFFTGRETYSQKRESFRRFRAGETKLFIISLRAGAGLDGLQYAGCSNVVFGELDWSPAVHEQAIGRVSRDGIDTSVTAWFLVADEGSDPNMAEILGVKRGQLQGIRDPNGDLVLGKLDPDAIKRLARQFLVGQGLEVPEKAAAEPKLTPTAEAQVLDLFGLLETG